MLSYVKGVSERIGRVLKQQQVGVSYRPQRTINSLFPRSNEQDARCTQWSFVYYGQTERSLKTRIAEHRKAVSCFDHNSKIASHVHHLNHNMDFENAKVVGLEANYHLATFS